MEKLSRTLRIACIQLKVGTNKTENVARALEKIREAKMKGAELVSLPECFNSPYGTKFFQQYAEAVPEGETSKFLSEISKELGIYLIAGSIPESKENKLYNTSTIWDPNGNLIGTYRKMHLFDIDIPGEITFKESDSLTAGNSFTTFDVKDFKIGVGICYDIRFEEFAKIYRKKGCNLLVYPGAFNMKTGPLHWELLARARANDNQCYTALISPARDVNADYVAWGHTMVVDPWAKVVETVDSEEGLIVTDLDLSLVDKVRANIPVYNQRRSEIYDTIDKK
ncbi:CLUMA_CG004793, isoform A [Clunio marinus]|uniref:omega-amidase n=1 Tax=Clunio marinus TaxID=568069 RepID=A0A1J1HY92_9DIPT|nr:CLUMA_CG004793, isoform A [Clunio marinus]